MQPNQTIRLQASGIMIAGQAAYEATQENLLLGTLTRLRRVEDQIVAVKVQVGAGTFEEENRVKNLQRKELSDKKLKEGEQKLRNQCKKVDKNASKVAKKREETDQKPQELLQKAPAVTQEIQELSSALTTHQDTIQLVGKAAQLAEKAKEKEEIEEKLKYGAKEVEVVAEGQAWSLAAGTSGRYLDIVTMHHADVPQDATERAI